MIGQRFGSLVVVEASLPTIWREKTWRCSCDCGRESIVRGKRLRSGGTRSCGCLIRSNGVTHGGKGTRLHRIWAGMRNRCRNANSKDYPRYGGRGIKPCESWERFDAFRAWAYASGYADGLFIDRRDCDQGYTPENCRWLSPAESSRNTRAVKLSHTKAAQIRAAVDGGATHAAVAASAGVSRSNVSLIVEGKAWV